MPNAETHVHSYAGPLTRVGVTVVDETRGYTVITIPSKSILPIKPLHAGTLGGALMAVSVALRWVFPATHPDLFTTVGGALALAIIVTSVRGRPTILRIESGMFHARFPNNDSQRNPPPKPLPLDAIYRIYYVNHARAIFVRATGHEMIEIPIEHSEAVAIEMEKLLNQLIMGREPADLSKSDSVV